MAPSAGEQARVLAKLEHLDAILVELERHAGVTADELERDIDSRRLLEWRLYLAIQDVLDTGAIIAASRGWGPIERYRDIAEQLRTNGVLEPELAGRIGAMAGFRNLLVHEYEDVKPLLLSEYAQQLDDFRQFAESIARYVFG